MKYLSIFILTLFAIFCVIDSSYSELSSNTELTKGKKAKSKAKSKKGKSKSKAKKGKKGKKSKKGKKAKKPKTKIVCKNKCKKMKMPAMPKPLKPLKLSKADMAVCGNGKNLGTVDVGYNCSSQFTPQCKKMVVRQANVPVKSKISKLKKAALLLKKSKKPTKLKKPKKKWSLKGRYAKYHHKIKLTYKQKAHKRKLMMAKLKKTNLKKWAKMAIAGRMQAKKDAANKKKLAAKAKRLTQKILAGKMAAVKKALHLKTQKKKKAQAKARKKAAWRKLNPEKGKYCVEAVEMNISYCCIFHSRSSAVKLANTEPAGSAFMKQVRRGWVSKIKDKERRAKEKIRQSAEALTLMKKNMKKAKKARKAAAAAKIARMKKLMGGL